MFQKISEVRLFLISSILLKEMTEARHCKVGLAFWDRTLL
jgi:hypothetical protein